MRFRIELVIANEVGQEQQRIVALEKSCNPGDVSRCGLGLTVADSKSLLGTVQQNLIKTEVQAMSVAHADCPHCLAPMKRKDVRPIEYRTLFGKYTLDNERLFTCCCQEQEKKSFSLLNDAIVTHTHPELSYFQARWASLISYQQSLRLLKDVFPIEGAISLSNMKIKVPQIGQRIESEREAQTTVITGFVRQG